MDQKNNIIVQYSDGSLSLLGSCGRSLGVFGLSWAEKVAAEMLSVLKGTDYEGTIKDFWGGSGLNTGLIKTLHKYYESYLLSGMSPPVFDGHVPDSTATQMANDLEETTKIPYAVNMEFLRSIYTLARNGEIAFKYYDPVRYAQVKEETGAFDFKDIFRTAGDKMNVFLIAGGVAAALLMFSYMNQLSKR